MQTTTVTFSDGDDITVSFKAYDSGTLEGGMVIVRIGEDSTYYHARNIEQAEKLARLFGEAGDQLATHVLTTMRGADR